MRFPSFRKPQPIGNGGVKPKAIVWDLGAVLDTRSVAGVVNILVKDIRSSGRARHFSEGEIAAKIATQYQQTARGYMKGEKDLDKVKKELSQSFSLDAIEEATKYLLSFEPNPRAWRIAERAHSEGIKQGVLSDSPKEKTDLYRQELERVRYDVEFSAMVFSSEERMMKDDRQIYERLLERMRKNTGNSDLTPRDCLFVDDYEPNIDVARGLGFRTALYDGRDSYNRFEGLLASA